MPLSASETNITEFIVFSLNDKKVRVLASGWLGLQGWGAFFVQPIKMYGGTFAEAQSVATE